MKGIIQVFRKQNIICKGTLLFYFMLAVSAGDSASQQYFDSIGYTDAVEQRKKEQAQASIFGTDELREFEVDAFNETCRFAHLVQTADVRVTGKLTFLVIPSFTNVTTNWKLRCRRQPSNTEDIFDHYSPDYEETYHSYNGTDMEIYGVDKAPTGLYIIDFCETDEKTIAEVYVSNEYPHLLDLMDTGSTPREIKTKMYFKNNSAIISWPDHDVDDMMVQFSVYINAKRLYKSANEIFRMEGENVTLVERNTATFKINDLVYRQRYYVNIFLSNASGLSIPFANTSFVFEKVKPIRLRDGVAAVGNLTSNTEKLSFRYKVRNTMSPSFGNKLLIYVIPCGGAVQIEIKHRKKLIQTRYIDRYTKFEITNLTAKDRYIIKTRNKLTVPTLVEVYATMRQKLFPMPDPPFDHNVNCHTENSSIVISWLPIVSNESLLYCVYASELKNNSAVSTVNECDTPDRLSTKIKFTAHDCIKQQPTLEKYQKRMSLTLYKKKPGRTYMVQVVARRPKIKRFIWYSVKEIHTSENTSYCLSKDITSSS